MSRLENLVNLLCVYMQILYIPSVDQYTAHTTHTLVTHE